MAAAAAQQAAAVDCKAAVDKQAVDATNSANGIDASNSASAAPGHRCLLVFLFFLMCPLPPTVCRLGICSLRCDPELDGRFLRSRLARG